MLFFVLMLLIGGLLVRNAVKRHRRLSALRRTPTTSVADLRSLPVEPGRAYEVSGVAQAGEAPLRAPLSGLPCVWFRVRIVDRSRRVLQYGRRSRVPVRDARSDVPFVLDDGTGRIRVDVRGADVLPGDPRVKRRELASGGPGGWLPGSLAALVTSGALPGTPPALKLGREYDYEEWVLDNGGAAYALGTVQGTGEDLAVAGGPHLIGAGTEEEVGAGLRRSLLTGCGVGVPMVVVSLAILVLGTLSYVR